MIRGLSVIRHEEGSSVVEFALILPVFVAFVFGMVNCGLMLWTQLGIEHGAIAAARCVTINPSVCPNPSSSSELRNKNASICPAWPKGKSPPLR